MRTIWESLGSVQCFRSYERGTWPYDVAVAVIVMFVLLSPRGWFHDRPPVGPPPNPAMIQFQGTDSEGTVEKFRVDARLLSDPVRTPESELEHQLHEAVSHNVRDLGTRSFQILRIEPVRGGDGTVAYYDIFIKP